MTALKTLTLRLRGAKVELEEAGLDAENMVETTATLQKKLLALSGGKVDIMEDADTFKNTTQILREMAKAWEDMSDIERASALELMGGKRQANILSAIIQNFDLVEDAIESSAESAGSAMRENEVWLDSIEGRISLFTNSVQTMWNNALDSDIVKTVVDIGTGLIKIVDSLGLVKTLIFAIGTYVVQKHFKGDLIGGILGYDTSPKGLEKNLKDLEDKYKKAQKKYQASPTVANEKAKDEAKNTYESYKKEVQPTLDLEKQRTDLNQKLEDLKSTRTQIQQDLQVAQDNLVDITMNGISQDVRDVIDVDTFDIDAQIEAVQQKLDVAQKQLKEAQKAPWELYKNLESSDPDGEYNPNYSPAKDRDARIDEKIAEVQKYKDELHDLQQTKKQVVDQKIDTLVTEGAQGQVEALQTELDSTNLKIQQTEANLKNVEIQAGSTGTAGMTAFQKIKAGAITAGKAVLKFGKELAMSMAYSAAITAVLESLTIIGGWIGDAWNALKPKTVEELQDELEQTESELSNVESEIRSLNSELDDTKDRIEELSNQGSLSYVEQEELSRLKSVTEELKAQIALKETLQQSLQTNANSQAVQATDAYLDTSFMSDKTKTERQEEAKETGKSIGKVAGTIIGGVVGALVGNIPGLIIGIAAGNAAGGWLGGEAGSAIAGASYDSEQTVGEALDGMIATRKELKKAQADALADKDAEAYNEATEALTTYDNQMAKHISQIQENYNAMDWENADPAVQQKMKDYADWLSKYSISMETPGAKSAALERIFGAEADEDVKALKEDIEDAMEAAKANDTEPTFDFYGAFDGDKFESLKQRIYEMGLTVADVKYYFLDLAKAEKEAEDSYTTYETVKQINSLSSGVKSLKDAFGEITSEGFVSTETLVGLEETFGKLGTSWTNFVDSVATGTSSIDKMIESINQLVEAYLTEQLAQGPIGAEEQLKTILLLQQMGIKNAKQYMDAMQKSQMVKDIAKDFVDDENEANTLYAKITDETATEEEKTRYSELKNKTKADYINHIEDLYNVDLSEEEERLLVEKAITAERAEQHKIAMQKAAVDHEQAVRDKEIAEDALHVAKADLKEAQDNLHDYETSWEQYAIGSQLYYKNKDTGKTVKSDVWWNKHRRLEDEVDTAQTLFDTAQQKADSITIPMDVDPTSAEENAERAKEDLEKLFDDMGLTVKVDLNDLEFVSGEIDKIQDAYSTLSSAVKDYNTNGFMTLDNLQALLALEPEYLACLQMENGQLSINQLALEGLIQSRLADAKATVVQSTMEQLHALAARTAEDAVIDSGAAASNAVGGLGEYASALGTVAQDAIAAAGSVAAFNAAVEGAQNNEFVDQSEIDTILNNMNTTLEMIDQVGSSLHTNFNAIVGGDDGSSNKGGGSDADTPWGRIEDKYAGKLANLEGQITYRKNEIELRKAKDQAIPISYYVNDDKTGLIDIEKQIMKTNKDKRYELNKEIAKYADGEAPQELADALWKTEHAVQESAIRLAELRQEIVDNYKQEFDDLAEAYDKKDDLLQDQQNILSKERELLKLLGDEFSMTGYEEQLNAAEKAVANNEAKVYDLRAALQAALDSGYLTKGTEEYFAMEDSIRTAEEAVIDSKIAVQELYEEISNVPVEAFEKLTSIFDFKTGLYDSQISYIEGYADLLETQGIDVPEELYKSLTAINAQKKSDIESNIVAAQDGLATIEQGLMEKAARQGLDTSAWTEDDWQAFFVKDEEWQDAYNTLVDYEAQLQDCEKAQAEWNKTIIEQDWEKFDRFMDRLSDAESDIDRVRNLLSDEDMAFDDGTWTEAGITSLGAAYSQMQNATQKTAEYGKEIEELTAQYKSGAISEKDYYDRLQELEDGQWDAIESYNDAKDAIVELEEARIDHVEEGINEEIEAYQELIDLKREELDAERDLYNFKKDVEKQTKDIASLQRRIASLSGSTDMADVASRRQLEAELRDAQEGLDDTYYNHAKDAQSKALDDELEMYQKAREDYLELLRDTLEDAEAIVEEKIQEVLVNADVVLGGLISISDEYGVTLDSSLVTPWEHAAMVSQEFKNTVGTSLGGLINEDGIITLFGNTVSGKLNTAFSSNGSVIKTLENQIKNIFSSGGNAAKVFETTTVTEINKVRDVVNNASSAMAAKIKLPWTSMTGKNSPVNTFSNKVLNGVDNVVDEIKDSMKDISNYLKNPWSAGSSAVNTFYKNVENALDKAIKEARDAGKQIEKSLDIKIPSYTGSAGSGGGSGSGGSKNNGAGNGGGKTSNEYVKALQKILKNVYGKKITIDGIFGTGTSNALKAVQKVIGVSASGKYNKATQNGLKADIDDRISLSIKEGQRSYADTLKSYKNIIPNYKYFATGTLGTKKDQWAITDESWIGEEITLAAGKNGQLQYLKKGSAVMPADISANLVEWGKLDPNMMNVVNPQAGINLMNNYVSKPELNLTFDALLKAESITQEAIPAVKKLITQELDRFSKQLNYSLKKVGAV